MIIPKNFCVAGMTYKVEMKKEVKHNFGQADEQECHGLCKPDQLKIELVDSLARPRTEAIFLHELTHAILAEMGHEIYDDECFVHTFSSFLHQALTSQKGEWK
jgi:hypothetical protein